MTKKITVIFILVLLIIACKEGTVWKNCDDLQEEGKAECEKLGGWYTNKGCTYNAADKPFVRGECRFGTPPNFPAPADGMEDDIF